MSFTEFDDLRLSGEAGDAPDPRREPPPDTVNSACLLQQRLCVSNVEIGGLFVGSTSGIANQPLLAAVVGLLGIHDL